MLIFIFGSKSGFGDDFGQYDTKTIIFRCFLAKRLLEIALSWRHLRFQVIKTMCENQDLLSAILEIFRNT